MGIDAVKKTHVQRALTRLMETGIVSRNTGGPYTFENPAFQEWLRTVAE